MPLFGCPFKVGGYEPGLIELGSIDRSLGKAGTAEIGTPEVAALHIRTDEAALLKVGVAEVRRDEALGKVRASQIRAAEVHLLGIEILAAEAANAISVSLKEVITQR